MFRLAVCRVVLTSGIPRQLQYIGCILGSVVVGSIVVGVGSRSGAVGRYGGLYRDGSNLRGGRAAVSCKWLSERSIERGREVRQQGLL